MQKRKKFTVKISEERLCKDPDIVNAILERVSRIIGNSYISKDTKAKT